MTGPSEVAVLVKSGRWIWGRAAARRAAEQEALRRRTAGAKEVWLLYVRAGQETVPHGELASELGGALLPEWVNSGLVVPVVADHLRERALLLVDADPAAGQNAAAHAEEQAQARRELRAQLGRLYEECVSGDAITRGSRAVRNTLSTRTELKRMKLSKQQRRVEANFVAKAALKNQKQALANAKSKVKQQAKESKSAFPEAGAVQP